MSIESFCHRCDGPNITWSAPSPLWNEVMRNGDMGGEELYDGIVCPICFAVLAEQQGTAFRWRLNAEHVRVNLPKVNRDGLVWDDVNWLWV